MVGKKPPGMVPGATLRSGILTGNIFEKPPATKPVKLPKPKPSLPSSQKETQEKVRKPKPRDVEAEIAQVRAKKQQEQQKTEEEERILEEMRKQREEERKQALADAQSLLHSSPLPGGKEGKKKGLPPWAQRGTKEKGLRRSV